MGTRSENADSNDGKDDRVMIRASSYTLLFTGGHFWPKVVLLPRLGGP